MATLARLLEEIGANGTASPTTQLVNGWLLRCAPELPFRRSNAAIPLGAITGDPDELAGTVAAVEDFYERRGLTPRVQVSSAAPPALDEFLARRGYSVDTPTDILVARTDEIVARATPHAGVHVRIARTLGDEWARDYGEMFADAEVGVDRIAAYGRLLDTLGPVARAATAELGGSVAGVGFGVYERGWLGVYGMGTAASARRRGVATTVLHALAVEAQEHAAPNAYLQVSADNAGAKALYERVGFAYEYSYHYRVKP